jgi:predicted transcriptional regulator
LLLIVKNIIVILQYNYDDMGVTKTELFSDVQNDLALAAKALAHPARVAILQHLLKTNACINGDLVQELGLAQATISQHLRELKDIGIIQGTIEGASVSYCINPNRWSEIKDQFNEIFDGFNPPQAGDCC